MIEQTTLEVAHPELHSLATRVISSLREEQPATRRNSLNELVKIVTEEFVSAAHFDELFHMALRNLIKCYSDSSEAIRQGSLSLTIQFLKRCKSINSFLPYLFEALKDRTNCHDLEGIDHLPQKMRPAPGQKPKVVIKIIQTCQQVRILFCSLLRTVLILLDKDKHEMVKHLDDMVNILRTLIMDPAPQVQKLACETLQLFCQHYSDLLLHFTQIMGRAVLLPLVSKKSKIRIAALNTLTSIFWCGLWKYNAFVFENLIGFRDPNSVPIKDFYQPSNSINYLATFINDSNLKVRRQFMRHLKIWICDLNDKYDHHAKIVPYLLSGLFDQDQQVKKTALSTIEQIGKQHQQEKQKQFRQNKQFAIDAKWTWEGKLTDLPVHQPLTGRPTLGSRYFIRGHVRRFWHALYKQIRDINIENRYRSARLALYGVIFTQNYMTQYLDNMIPQLLPSIIPAVQEDKKISQIICSIFYYIGRYCQQSGYAHLMKSALEGELIQNQEFIRCAMKGLSMLIKGNLEAVPSNLSLAHKKQQIIILLEMLESTQIAGDMYNFNCVQGRQIVLCIMEGMKKATEEERNQILSSHYLTMMKILAVSYYQQLYSNGFSWKKSEITQLNFNPQFQQFTNIMNNLNELYSDSNDKLNEYLNYVDENPPTMMDSDWKILIILYRYFARREICPQFQQIQSTLCSGGKSIDALMFGVKFLYNLVITWDSEIQGKNIIDSPILLKDFLLALRKYKPIKKVPVYDQHLQKPDNEQNVIKTTQENYVGLFVSTSMSVSAYFMKKISIKNSILAQILHHYVQAFKRIKKGKQSLIQAVKTIWIVFERLQIEVGFSKEFLFKQKGSPHPMIPEMIDFCIDRIEQNHQSKVLTMVFSTLMRIMRCCPKLATITQKLPTIYPQYPQLLDKLFKYCLDEKDHETKRRYMQLLTEMGRKMPDWFKHEAHMAKESKRYERSKLLQELIYEANI